MEEAVWPGEGHDFWASRGSKSIADCGLTSNAIDKEELSIVSSGPETAIAMTEAKPMLASV